MAKGFPKYKKGEKVIFSFNFKIGNKICSGEIYIIDAYGSIETPYDVSYDILGDDNLLYKHIPESDILRKCE